MTKQDTRKLSRLAAEAIRKQAVLAVISQGMSPKDAAGVFGVTLPPDPARPVNEENIYGNAWFINQLI